MSEAEFFRTLTHKIPLHFIHQRTQHSGLMAKGNHVWDEMVRCSYSKCLIETAWGTKPTAATQYLGVPPIPSTRHQLWDGKQCQREIVDLGLTAEECEARTIFSIRLRPVWTLPFAVIPAHAKNKNIWANLTNVFVLKLITLTKVTWFLLHTK